MKKILLISVLTVCSLRGMAQYDQRPSRSRFYNSKFSTFMISPGDILVYEVNKNDSIYNYVVTIKKFGTQIDFDYAIPQKEVTGSVTIEPGALNNAVQYDSLGSAKTVLSDESILWLSRKNFNDMMDYKATKMNMGDSAERFIKKTTETLRINYKGKEKIITVHNLESNSLKSLAVLSTDTNPLIIKMDLGYTVTLKEVR